MDGAREPVLECLVIQSHRGLERADQISDDIFRRVVQQRRQSQRPRSPGFELMHKALHQHAMLGYRKCAIPFGLAVPARHPGEPMGDVLDFDVQRRGVEQIKAPAAQHALPRSRYGIAFWCSHRSFASFPFPSDNTRPRTHSEDTISIAKILAPVTGGARDTAVLANAIEAAKPFNAHVMAFFVRPDLSEALAFFTDGVSGVVVEEVVKATKDAGDEAARRIETAIEAVCARASIERVRRPMRAEAVTLSLREVQRSFGDQLTAAARLSDLVVFGPIRDNDQAGLAEAFVQVLVETDRPVLRATDEVPNGVARRIALGWDRKTAAAPPDCAAIPHLQKPDRQGNR